jgi:hypothetical protein
MEVIITPHKPARKKLTGFLKIIGAIISIFIGIITLISGIKHIEKNDDPKFQGPPPVENPIMPKEDPSIPNIVADVPENETASPNTDSPLNELSETELPPKKETADSLTLYESIFSSVPNYDHASLTEYEQLANSLYYESCYKESARVNSWILRYAISQSRKNTALANLKLSSDCWELNTRNDFINEIINLSVKGIVNDSDVRFRKNPTINDDNIIRKLDHWEELAVIAQIDEGDIPNGFQEYANIHWYHVQDSKGNEGYVYGFYLWFVPNPPHR